MGADQSSPISNSGSSDQACSAQENIDSLLTLTNSSAYSPHSLRHIPQPRPLDAPQDVDVTAFSFLNAFEDLLAATQNIPLTATQVHFERYKALKHLFPEGEPQSFWINRLRSQGLLRAPQSVEEWVSACLTQVATNEMGELANVGEQIRGAALPGSQDRERFSPSISPIVSQARSALESILKEETKQQHNPTYQQGGRRRPKDFDYVYSRLQSEFPERQQTWDTFVKIIQNGATKDPESKPVEQSQPQEGSVQPITSTKEYTDIFGWKHSKTTTQEVDGQGNRIGTSMTWIITSGKNETPPGPSQSGDKMSTEHPIPKQVHSASAFHKEQEKQESDKDGISSLKEHQEYDDMFGFHHAKVRTRNLDKNGKEIGTSYSWTVTSKKEQQPQLDDEDGQKN